MQMLLDVFAPVLIAYQPIHAAKRQNRCSKRKKLLSVRRRHIHDHQLSHDREQRDEDDCANLHDPPIALCNHHEGPFEFECDDHREDHSEDCLKHGVIGRIEAAGKNARENLQHKIPHRKNNQDSDQGTENEDYGVLEPLVEGKPPPSRTYLRELVSHRHRHLHAPHMRDHVSRLTASFCRGIGRYSTPPPPCARTGCGESFMSSRTSFGISVLIGRPSSFAVAAKSGKSCVHVPVDSFSASASAFSTGNRFFRISPADCLSCAIALRPTSAMTRVWSSILAFGFCSTTLMSDAAGDCPSCGSIGPSTACLDMMISSAASAMSVPPDIA